tara:strand:+ start:337 stop:1155 length:819 start_codon:yes stop_codon:yes gene_type:complete
MITKLLYFQAFFIGICIGSFLNVVVFRLPNELSIIKPRSFCPNCRNKLSWRENIPLISWIIQRARCVNCKKPISIRYPLVELTTGILFAIFLNSSPSMYISSSNLIFNLTSSWIFLSILICIALIDIDQFWIPQGLINFGLFFGLLGLILVNILDSRFMDFNLLFTGIVSLLISFFIFETFRKFAKYIYKRDAIGKGDSKLIAMMALWLGPTGIILCLAISYIIAALFCLLGIYFKLINLKQVIPFAPFLSFGGLIVWLLGNEFFIDKLLLY